MMRFERKVPRNVQAGWTPHGPASWSARCANCAPMPSGALSWCLREHFPGASLRPALRAEAMTVIQRRFFQLPDVARPKGRLRRYPGSGGLSTLGSTAKFLRKGARSAEPARECLQRALGEFGNMNTESTLRRWNRFLTEAAGLHQAFQFWWVAGR